MVNDLRASISAAPPRDVESRTQVKAHIQVIVTNETLFTNELRINPEAWAKSATAATPTALIRRRTPALLTAPAPRTAQVR